VKGVGIRGAGHCTRDRVHLEPRGGGSQQGVEFRGAGLESQCRRGKNRALFADLIFH
jgi:hypothetical protein